MDRFNMAPTKIAICEAYCILLLRIRYTQINVSTNATNNVYKSKFPRK